MDPSRVSARRRVQEARGKVAPAPTYCPGRLPAEYRRRWGVSRPCSGWERVGPPRPRHQGHAPLLAWYVDVRRSCRPGFAGERGAAEPSAISTAPLHASRRFHARPIDQVVYLGPYSVDPMGILISGRASRLDAFSGYPCRTSATRRCRWRDNRCTGGPSVPVLSY